MVSLKLVLLLQNLLKNQRHFKLNLGWGKSKPQRTKGARVIKERERERESESSAKHNCVNNGMVFKFRFRAFARYCVVKEKQTDQTKFRTRQTNG